VKLKRPCPGLPFRMGCAALLAFWVPTVYADGIFTIAGTSITAVIGGADHAVRVGHHALLRRWKR